jgi:hypothetical protein
MGPGPALDGFAAAPSTSMPNPAETLLPQPPKSRRQPNPSGGGGGGAGEVTRRREAVAAFGMRAKKTIGFVAARVEFLYETAPPFSLRGGVGRFWRGIWVGKR